jgi:tartrate dehydrogenase/decarboxylase/D-malate dehydrogenase
MKKEYKIAVIPGDGVGIEVSKEAEKVGSAAIKKAGAQLKTEWYDWGCDYYLKSGKS